MKNFTIVFTCFNSEIQQIITANNEYAADIYAKALLQNLINTSDYPDDWEYEIV